eukprot:CAMPEP_0198220814 /NCGR_PEP_ID=MMETSP1445-20131203/80819_1 /TAXON_ID=36898 /ORGANISM="Pyramimonas sp., Strain CCMP2087" /LENGTH=63 /DNA_ID=CAMNT_0043898721 /DNA_START=130 /DNA_END=318 /DNA_ORIENTATION=+
MDKVQEQTHTNTLWEELKHRGTAAFKKGEFTKAIHYYKEAAEGAKLATADAAPLHSNCSVALL